METEVCPFCHGSCVLTYPSWDDKRIEEEPCHHCKDGMRPVGGWPMPKQVGIEEPLEKLLERAKKRWEQMGMGPWDPKKGK